MKLAGGGISLQPTETPLPVVEVVEVVATESSLLDTLKGFRWGTVSYWGGMALIVLAVFVLAVKFSRKWRNN